MDWAFLQSTLGIRVGDPSYIWCPTDHRVSFSECMAPFPAVVKTRRCKQEHAVHFWGSHQGSGRW